MIYEKILKIAGLSGKILLQSGAETYRVEETITRICESFEVEDAHAFVTPSGFFISFSKDDKTFSKVYRSKQQNLNLEKINLINDLSRKLVHHQISMEDTFIQLEAIEQQQDYSSVIKIIASGFIALCFTYFFQGSLMDGICAFPIGIIIQYLTHKLDNRGINSLVKILCLSCILTFLTLILVNFNVAQSKDSIIMGCLMLLVPGVAITNAIRDSISGDLISGITRGIEACLIALSIALGAGITMSLWMTYIGGI